MLLAFLPLALVSQLALEFKGSTAIRWRELRQVEDKFSGLELNANFGAFSPQDSLVSAGIEAETYESNTSSNPQFVALTSDSSGRTIALSQAFIRFRHTERFSMGVMAGKFIQPYPLSPIVISSEWNPEGIIEAFSWTSEISKTYTTLIAGQHPLLQSPGSNLDSLNMTRKWLFRQGVLVHLDLADLTVDMSANHLHITSVPENLKPKSAARGNSFIGNLNSPRLKEKFSISEFAAAVEASPLGLSSRIEGAIAINWRSNSKHRGYFIEGKVGNAWVADNLVASLSYYYAEPDITLAALADHRFGFTNRESFKSSISYYPTKNLEGEFSYLYSKTIATSPLQSSRKEAIITWKIKF